MIYKFIAIIVVMFSVITGCKTTSPVQKLQSIINESPNAIDYLVNELKTKKIIFINEDHIIVNEELFLKEHLQTLYDAGIRYMFVESDITKEIDGHVGSYPWMQVGYRFEELDMIQAIKQLTSTDDAFRVIPAEAGKDYAKYDKDNDVAWMNYRDTYAANTIIEMLNNAPADAKAIILYGGAHGIKKITKPAVNNEMKIDRVPLGYLLAEHYGSAFSLLAFINDSDIKPEFTNEWKESVSGSKIIVSKNSNLLHRVLYADSWKRNANFDLFISEKEVLYGTPYNYVPIDDQLRYFVRFLKEYALKDPKWENVSPAELGAGYFLVSYYLKLYYGEHFKYAAWKKSEAEPDQSLLHALEELEAYAFNENVKPSELIDFHYSLEDMRLYCRYMFYSTMNSVFYNEWDIADANIENLIHAQELFPEDIWSLYLIGFVQAETGAYRDGLAAFQKLFANDLSLCMASLPLAYKKAAKCAAELGNTSLAEEYTILSENLYNEYGIDPSNGPFSIELGYHFSK